MLPSTIGDIEIDERDYEKEYEEHYELSENIFHRCEKITSFISLVLELCRNEKCEEKEVNYFEICFYSYLHRQCRKKIRLW